MEGGGGKLKRVEASLMTCRNIFDWKTLSENSSGSSFILLKCHRRCHFFSPDFKKEEEEEFPGLMNFCRFSK